MPRRNSNPRRSSSHNCSIKQTDRMIKRLRRQLIVPELKNDQSEVEHLADDTTEKDRN